MARKQKITQTAAFEVQGETVKTVNMGVSLFALGGGFCLLFVWKGRLCVLI